MELKVYHNNRCSKSRCAVDFLNEKNLEFDTIEYLKTPLNETELSELIKKLGIPAEELVRKGEADYKTHFAGKTLSEQEWVRAMVKFPKLIERPIVVKGNKAVIGRPIERIINIL